MKTPVNVGYLVHHFVHAGLENFVLTLMNNLDRKRFRPHLYVMFGSDESFLKRLNPDIPVFHLGMKHENDRHTLRQFAKKLREDEIQILQIHNWGTFLEGLLTKWYYPGLKLIHVQQGMEYELTLKAPPWKRKARKLIRHLLIPFVEVAVGCSGQAKAYLEKEWGARRTVLIYNSVDTRKFNGKGKPVPEINNYPGFKVVTVGRIVEVKNFMCLFKAIHLLRNQIPDIRLYHIGDSHPRGQKVGQELMRFVEENNLQEHIVFMGLQNDIPSLLPNFDVFSLTSFSEGLSFSILEALASGLPAVVTAVGGNPEVVQDGVNGFLVPSDDEHAVAEAIYKLYKDPELRKTMGRQAREIVLKKFSVDVMVQKYQDLYTQVLT